MYCAVHVILEARVRRRVHATAYTVQYSITVQYSAAVHSRSFDDEPVHVVLDQGLVIYLLYYTVLYCTVPTDCTLLYYTVLYC